MPKYSTSSFNIKNIAIRYSDFAPRLFNFYLSLGMKPNDIMPSRAFFSDENQGYPIILVAKHFGSVHFLSIIAASAVLSLLTATALTLTTVRMSSLFKPAMLTTIQKIKNLAFTDAYRQTIKNYQQTAVQSVAYWTGTEKNMISPANKFHWIKKMESLPEVVLQVID